MVCTMRHMHWQKINSSSRWILSYLVGCCTTLQELLMQVCWDADQVVGEGRCPIVDTWWQTETGAIMITPLPGMQPALPSTLLFDNCQTAGTCVTGSVPHRCL